MFAAFLPGKPCAYLVYYTRHKGTGPSKPKAGFRRRAIHDSFVQLVRTQDSQSWNCGFKSRRGCQSIKSAYSKYRDHLKAGVAGSSPAGDRKVSLAQGSEHRMQQKRFVSGPVVQWQDIRLSTGRYGSDSRADRQSWPLRPKRSGHVTFNHARRVRTPQGLPICIRNSTGRVPVP